MVKDVKDDWKIWLIGALWAVTVLLVTWGYNDFSRRLSELESHGTPAMRERVIAVERDMSHIRDTLRELNRSNLVIMEEVKLIREDLLTHDYKTTPKKR